MAIVFDTEAELEAFCKTFAVKMPGQEEQASDLELMVRAEADSDHDSSAMPDAIAS